MDRDLGFSCTIGIILDEIGMVGQSECERGFSGVFQDLTLYPAPYQEGSRWGVCPGRNILWGDMLRNNDLTFFDPFFYIQDNFSNLKNVKSVSCFLIDN